MALILGTFVLIATTTAQEQPRKKYPYPEVRDMRGVIPPGPKVAPYNSPPLGDGPFDFETYEQRKIRVSVVTKGLSHPWSLAFLPGGDMLITERVGRLRLVRNGVLVAQPAPLKENGRAEKVDATLTVARPVLLDSLFRGAPLASKILSGEVKLEGDRAAMGRLAGWFDAFPADFPIVTRPNLALTGK